MHETVNRTIYNRLYKIGIFQWFTRHPTYCTNIYCLSYVVSTGQRVVSARLQNGTILPAAYPAIRNYISYTIYFYRWHRF
jgi:hypothetical protein